MKTFIQFFDKIINRPSYKFFLNFFFLKNNFYFNLKNILYIHFFNNLKNIFKLKILKFNYNFYKNFLWSCIILSSIIQICVLIICL